MKTWAKKAYRRCLCLLRGGHDWFVFADHTRQYNVYNMPVQHRCCQRCGKHQMGIPTINEEAAKLDGYLRQEAFDWFWIPYSRGVKAVKDHEVA